MAQPKPTRKQAAKMIREAAESGRVEFANPKAAEMLSGPRVDPREKDFDYLEASPLEPATFPEGDEREKWSHGGGVHFQWGLKGFGFGEASIVFRNGKWIADTEHLGREFLIKILTRWAKQMKI